MVKPLNPEQMEQLCAQGFLYVPGHLDSSGARTLGDTILAIGESQDRAAEEDTYDEYGVSSNLILGNLDGFGDVAMQAKVASVVMNLLGVYMNDQTLAMWQANSATLLRYRPNAYMNAHFDDKVRFLGCSAVVNATEEAEATVYNTDPKLGGVAVATEVMKPGDLMLYVARPIIDTEFNSDVYVNQFPWHSVKYDGNKGLRAAVSYDFTIFAIYERFVEWALNGRNDLAPRNPVEHALFYDALKYTIMLEPELTDTIRPMEREFAGNNQ